jgi:hypothetical protein
MSDESVVEPTDPWQTLRYFLGRWQGSGTGKPGESRVEREYQFVLDEQFIQMTDRAVYEPQERNPEGEIHEEIGYFSYDKSRQRHVFREFHVEGYVNQYVMEEWDPSGKKIVFRTEAIENMPSGWQTRTTYEVLGENMFRETFDLVGPGQALSCFITIEFERDSGRSD